MANRVPMADEVGVALAEGALDFGTCLIVEQTDEVDAAEVIVSSKDVDLPTMDMFNPQFEGVERYKVAGLADHRRAAIGWHTGTVTCEASIAWLILDSFAPALVHVRGAPMPVAQNAMASVSAAAVHDAPSDVLDTSSALSHRPSHHPEGDLSCLCTAGNYKHAQIEDWNSRRISKSEERAGVAHWSSYKLYNKELAYRKKLIALL